MIKSAGDIEEIKREKQGKKVCKRTNEEIKKNQIKNIPYKITTIKQRQTWLSHK